jgi:outer membrane protein assembly factor BamB
MTLMNLAWLAVAVLASQAPAAKGTDRAVDRVFLQDRTEIQGEILELTREGRLKIRVPNTDRPVDLGIEELSRIRFTTDEARPGRPSIEQVRLAGGGSLSGRLVSFDGETALVESSIGTLKIRRQDVRAFLLGAPGSPLPEIRDEKKDVVLREVEKKGEEGEKPVRECVAEYGRVESIGEKVALRTTVAAEKDAKGHPELREFDRASVKHVYLARGAASADSPAGLFIKVTLKNGDRWAGVLQSLSGGQVSLFSHLFGSVTLEKTKIHSLIFIQQAQLTAGNILVTDQSGIHEFDARGREIWIYGQGVQAAAMARKLKNGNVLVADPTSNSVLEIRPLGRSGGEIVWRLDEIQNPTDASRLENGNTLVAEQYSNRVAEYDGRTREVVWQVPTQQPKSAQRLDNGNTLITTNAAVFEVDMGRTEKWRANLRAGAIRPHTATRLENGNTLITDLLRNQVVEIDSKSEEVWKQDKLIRPIQAVRLEDGNTLILEQGANRVVEVDPANLRTEIINKGLNAPQGLSSY